MFAIIIDPSNILVLVATVNCSFEMFNKRLGNKDLLEDGKNYWKTLSSQRALLGKMLFGLDIEQTSGFHIFQLYRHLH